MSSMPKRTRLYITYSNIKSRCDNPNQSNYFDYGARGIKNYWETYKDFLRDMENSYYKHIKKYGESDTQIDRIDNDGHYCKENCKWSTRKEQAYNKRNTRRLSVGGEFMTVKDIANNLGVPIWRVQYLIYRKHLSGDEIVNIA